MPPYVIPVFIILDAIYRSALIRSVLKNRRRKQYDEHDGPKKQKEYFDSKSPPRKSASVDSKMVGGAGIVMFLMTNFKKEIGQILVAISKIIGGS